MTVTLPTTPQRLSLSHEVARNRLLEEHDEQKSLSSKMEDALWFSLPWVAETSDEDCDEEHLFRLYAASVSAVEQARENCVGLLREVIRASIEFRTETPVPEDVRSKLVQEELDRLSGMVTLPPATTDRVFNARLTGQPLKQVREQLDGELRRRTGELVRGFLGLCISLVEKEVLGLINWANAEACELSFLKRVLIHRRTGHVIRDGQVRHESFAVGAKIITSQTEHSSGENEIRLARHEHHLRQATSTPLDEALPAIPSEFQVVVQAIPAWMRPFMRLVSGIQFRSTVYEIEIDKKSWEHVRELPPREEYDIDADPALALGPIVLLGWGDEHQERENHRRDQESRTHEQVVLQTARADVLLLGGVLFAVWQAVALLLVGAGAVNGSALFHLGIVLAAAGLGVVAGLVWYADLGRERQAGPRVYAAAIITAAAGVAGVQLLGVAFVRSSFWFGVSGVAVLWLGAHLMNAFWKCRSE